MVADIPYGCSAPLNGFYAATQKTHDIFATNFGTLPWSERNDAFPATLSALIGTGSPAFQALYDFNGSSQAGTMDVGEYVYYRV